MARSRRTGSSSARRGRAELLSPAELLDFVGQTPSAVGTGEIARAFGLAPAAAPHPPEVAVIERYGSDEDGAPLARPVAWPGPDPAPVVRVADTGIGEPFPIGARAAARLVVLESGGFEAWIIRRIDPAGERIVGVFHRGREGGRVVPADRRNRTEYEVTGRDTVGAGDGELVTAEQLPAARLGRPRARIVERLGPASDPGAISLLAIASYDIPTDFPAAAIAEAEAALPVDAHGRTDLRGTPLVTIDGSDAHDFDDAVWAEPDPDPDNSGGWHLVVAIADVAWYVRPGTVLDQEAMRRGNSVYFPDRVVPMLPEALSNELCSLKPGVDRACLAVHLWIDAEGRKRRHRFERAVMRSAARLTYEEAQAIRDGSEGSLRLPREVAAVYGAFGALARARVRRGALELEIAENRVVLNAEKRPAAVVPVTRLDSHRLIEEFMILANVAAAEELETRRQPCMYRVHDAADPEKLAALRDFLDALGIPGLAILKGQALKPELFNRVLRRAAETPQGAIVNDLVLRCQAQAAYSPDNIGHFGLALRRYAHFTSPIRRYADLLVHRALVSGANAAGLDFRAGGLPPDTNRERMAAIGEHISMTERRGAAAERAAIERYRATFLAGSIGGVFMGRISGVVPFGLFVTLASSGADGLVPISALPGDYYSHDEKAQRLVGRRFGRVFGLGDEVSVRLVEADGIGGRLLFRIEEGGTEITTRDRSAADFAGRPRASRQGRMNRRR